MRHNYKTKNTCSTKISFDLDGSIVRNVEFTGGCDGNLKVIPKLVEGFTVEQIVSLLGGTFCGRRPTSCADQLAIAVQKAYEKAGAK
jgi:uncharacterized protein (TIGR03905 family)